MTKQQIDWNPRNDANCEVLRPISPAERERQVAIAFAKRFTKEWSELQERYDDFTYSDSFLSISPATDELREKIEERIKELQQNYRDLLAAGFNETDFKYLAIINAFENILKQ